MPARTRRELLTHGVREVCVHRQAGRQKDTGWQGEEVSGMHEHDSQRKIRVTPALT